MGAEHSNDKYAGWAQQAGANCSDANPFDCDTRHRRGSRGPWGHDDGVAVGSAALGFDASTKSSVQEQNGTVINEIQFASIVTSDNPSLTPEYQDDLLEMHNVLTRFLPCFVLFLCITHSHIRTCITIVCMVAGRSPK